MQELNKAVYLNNYNTSLFKVDEDVEITKQWKQDESDSIFFNQARLSTTEVEKR